MAINIDTVFPQLEKEVAGYDVPIVDLIAVQTKDPFKVLVATILSARTKDETTAKASARLFKKVSDLDSLAAFMDSLQVQTSPAHDHGEPLTPEKLYAEMPMRST